MVGSEGPVVFWKGLKMSQKCPGCPKGARVGLGGPGAIQKVWGCPRGDLEGLGVLWWVQKVLLSSGRV